MEKREHHYFYVLVCPGQAVANFYFHFPSSFDIFELHAWKCLLWLCEEASTHLPWSPAILHSKRLLAKTKGEDVPNTGVERTESGPLEGLVQWITNQLPSVLNHESPEETR